MTLQKTNLILISFLCFFALCARAKTITETVHNTSYILCIDGGGSKSAIRLADKSGHWLQLKTSTGKWEDTACLGASNINNIGLEAMSTWVDSLMSLTCKLPSGETCSLQSIAPQTAILGGMASLWTSEKAAPVIQLFTNKGLPPEHILLEDDSQIALRLTNDFGAIVISGTGSICLGKAGTQTYREGGLGWVFGDEGSGYAIAKQAIVTALEQSLDIRPRTPLEAIVTQFLKEQLDIHSYGELIFKYSSGTIQPDNIAKLTPIIIELAAQKDPTAMTIINQAADDLAHQLAGVLQKVVDTNPTLPQKPFVVFLMGGLFKSNPAAGYLNKVMKSPRLTPFKTLMPITFNLEAIDCMPAEILLKAYWENLSIAIPAA